MENLCKNIEKHLHSVCFHPSRHVGSPGVAAAADYIEKTFREYGYTDVKQELFDTTGWRFGHMIFVDLDNGSIPVPGALACFFSRSTDVAGVPVWLTESDLKHLDTIDVKGKLCVVEFFSESADIRGRNGIAEDLDKLGAAGAVFISAPSYHTNRAPSSKIQRSPYLKQLGTAVVAEKGAYYLANHKNHRYHLIIDADTFPHKSSNVVAIRPGTGNKRAIFGCHHDAAPFGQAASDNASGVACVLEMARLLKDQLPEWTFEFASFDAEEYCIGPNPVGSDSYVKSHPERKWEFFMNFDSVGMHFGQDVVHIAFPEKLPEFDTIYTKLPFKNGGDDRSFQCIGVPVLWFNTHAEFQDFHTPLDTIETLDINKIARYIEEAVKLTNKFC